MGSEEKSVLVVDDHIENQIILKRILDSENISYDSAVNGEEALDYIENKEYAVILMDIQMPGKNGFEVVESMHDNNQLKTSPVIYITGSEISEDAFARGYANGGSDYMVKPVNPQAIIQKVKTFCDLFDLKHQNSNRIKDEFDKVLKAINEEIKSPMKSIMGDLKELLKNNDFDHKHLKLLQRIQKSGNELIEVSNRLSGFTNISEEKSIPKHHLKFDLSVLIVEDQIVDQQASIKILQELGCRITTASNGVEAILKMDHNTFDLVLLDINLPVMNGFDTLRNIIANHSKLPKIYALAAINSILKEQIISEKGFTKHLSKPLTKNLLINQIFEDFKHKIVKR